MYVKAGKYLRGFEKFWIRLKKSLDPLQHCSYYLLEQILYKQIK